jgi:hypothetical protein
MLEQKIRWFYEGRFWEERLKLYDTQEVVVEL